MLGRSGGGPFADLQHSHHGRDLLQRGRGVVRHLLPGSVAFTEALLTRLERGQKAAYDGLGSRQEVRALHRDGAENPLD